MSATKKVKIKALENINKNFLSLMLTLGFFLSSKMTIKTITRIQIKIEEPFREKKEKK